MTLSSEISLRFRYGRYGSKYFIAISLSIGKIGQIGLSNWNVIKNNFV